MKLENFKVETWMNEHENDCIYNLTESCFTPLTMRELLDICEVREAFMEDLLEVRLDYGPIAGSNELRQEIASLYKNCSPDQIAIAQGAINANAMALYELIEKGDHIVAFTLLYQQLLSLPLSIGAEITCIPCLEEADWQPDISKLEAALKPNTKVLCLNNPCNPTGYLYTDEQMQAIAQFARQHDLWLFVDEVYRGLNQHDDSFGSSFFDFYDQCIVSGGLSKTFALPGLRMGWLAAPQSFIDKITIRRDYHIISLPKINDTLSILALKNKDKILKRNRLISMQNRKTIQRWVADEPHIDVVFTDSTTLFIRYDMDIPSDELALRLQKETGVFFVPGTCFDIDHHLRLGGGIEPKQLTEGLAVFSKWLRQFDKEENQ